MLQYPVKHPVHHICWISYVKPEECTCYIGMMYKQKTGSSNCSLFLILFDLEFQKKSSINMDSFWLLVLPVFQSEGMCRQSNTLLLYLKRSDFFIFTTGIIQLFSGSWGEQNNDINFLRSICIVPTTHCTYGISSQRVETHCKKMYRTEGAHCKRQQIFRTLVIYNPTNISNPISAVSNIPWWITYFKTFIVGSRWKV